MKSLVVAPDRDRSGASNSLTLDVPVRVVQLDEHDLARRTARPPTACTWRITGMLEVEPDIVVSGINNTANLGDDVIYSGTVAAAMEGRFLGLPAVAMSLATADHKGKHYETAARAAVEIIARLQVRSAAGRHHPQRQRARPAVGRDRRLRSHAPGQPPSRRTLHAAAGSARPHRGGGSAPAGPEQDAGPGTDFHAVRTGHISITPIHVDLTRYQALEQVASWVGGLAAALGRRIAA